MTSCTSTSTGGSKYSFLACRPNVHTVPVVNCIDAHPPHSFSHHHQMSLNTHYCTCVSIFIRFNFVWVGSGPLEPELQDSLKWAKLVKRNFRPLFNTWCVRLFITCWRADGHIRSKQNGTELHPDETGRLFRRNLNRWRVTWGLKQNFQKRWPA